MAGSDATGMPVHLNTTEVYTLVKVCIQVDNETSNTTDLTVNGTQPLENGIPIHQIFTIISYVVICICGLLGNGLVIYVVLRFSKMKTVTNMYILNLAISDVMFLLSLPFLITTTILEYWMFGRAMCKIYFVCFSINFFTGVFTLTAMSADRYLAVCHPVRSVFYRTTMKAFFVCLSIWTLSFFVMLPIILYSTTVASKNYPDKYTCTVIWPSNQAIPGEKAFTWYTFLLGFSIPIALISVFYISVILRLRSVGPSKKSKERKKSNRKVTRMVLAMISVYVICWLPYWCFQGHLTFRTKGNLPQWQIYLFSVFTVLSFANSMLNPLLYAFLSEIFRKSFLKAFNCAHLIDTGRSHGADNSVFPRSTTRKENGREEKYEFTSMVNNTEDTVMHNNTYPSYSIEMKPTIDKSDQNENEPGEACERDESDLKLYVDKEIQTKRSGQEE